MKSYALLILSCLFLAASPALGASRSTCPDKVLEKGSVEGIYRGVECGDFCYGSMELANGEIFSFMAGEEDTENFFGQGTRQRVSADYQVEQFWFDSANDCLRREVMTSGRVLAAARGQKPSTQAAPVASSSAAQTAPARDAVSPSGKTYTNSIGIEFVLIPAGSFSRKLERPVVNEFGEKLYDSQTVRISKPFYLGKYEATQEKWVAVMGNNPSYVKGRTDPVERVNCGRRFRSLSSG